MKLTQIVLKRSQRINKKQSSNITNTNDVTEENIKEHNLNWLQILVRQYKILIIGGSGSGRTNSFFNLISQQPDIDKVYLYTKDPFEAKYQLLLDKLERIGLNHFIDSKAFIEY